MIPSALVVITIVISLIGCAPVDQSLLVKQSPAEKQPELAIYWVDVDGGAATLIVTPAGESILVDAGENKESHAKRIHKVAAGVAGLKQIDYFVATHWHADHYGGVSKLNQLMPIKNFYDHGLPNENDFSTKPDLQREKEKGLLDIYKKVTKESSVVLNPGDTLPLQQASGGPPISIKCLASAGRFLPETAKETKGLSNSFCKEQKSHPQDLTDNAMSIVLLLTYGQFSFLDPGDLTWQMESQLVCPENNINPVDLFQISHHGLDSSNNPVLIESIKPRVVVINNASKKGAEPNTMKTLQKISTIETIWQIHRNSRTGPELNTKQKYIANSEGETGAFIKASVHSDGKFSVQIGESGNLEQY